MRFRNDLKELKQQLTDNLRHRIELLRKGGLVSFFEPSFKTKKGDVIAVYNALKEKAEHLDYELFESVTQKILTFRTNKILITIRYASGKRKKHDIGKYYLIDYIEVKPPGDSTVLCLFDKGWKVACIHKLV